MPAKPIYLHPDETDGFYKKEWRGSPSKLLDLLDEMEGRSRTNRPRAKRRKIGSGLDVRPTTEKVCRCGVTFTTSARRRLYCDACRRKLRKLSGQVYRERRIAGVMAKGG